MALLKSIVVVVFLWILVIPSTAQGFLKRSGKWIVDDQNQEVLLRGMGLGGWMLQEGYMLETGDFAGTQHEIRDRIQEVTGKEGMEAFYEAWRQNHVTKRDIDSLSKWGFNSVRPALHYNLFTLPIDEEPVGGRQTWLETGFILLDSLISWCEANQMYVILDLHAAPGGQGRDNNISDRDPSKLSLWESSANRTKTIELWRKLAERYRDNPWVGGYDVINEPNWDFENSGNQNGCNCQSNAPLLDLYQKIITAIRSVDKNHLIFIEGNCWGGNFNGILSLTSFDSNLALSFHRYWNSNTVESIQEKINYRDTYNVPIWMGESGENSNHWFADAIALLEENKMGWAWWPEKKIHSIVGPMTVVKTPEYEQLLRYWRSGENKPDSAHAYQTLMQIAENLKIENCKIHYDVIDAMFRQPHTDEIIPNKEHHIPGTLFAVDFDLGKNGFAYQDVDYENSGGPGSSDWNRGWMYRNDGPDIEICSDSAQYTNGYHVGHIERDEWLAYTVKVDTTGYYNLTIRTATAKNSGAFHIEVDQVNVSGMVAVTHTGGSQRFTPLQVPSIYLTKGTRRLVIYFDEGDFNLNSLTFAGPFTGSEIAFTTRSAITDPFGKEIIVALSQSITNLSSDGSWFSVSDGEGTWKADSVAFESDNPPSFRLWFSETFLDSQTLTLSYSGGSVTGPNGIQLPDFTNFPVINIIIPRLIIPGTIECEDFVFNQGFGFENCNDIGGGKNAGWTDPGDYLDFLILITQTGTYTVNYRFSCYSGGGKAELSLLGSKVQAIDSPEFPATGGWQNWDDLSKEIKLQEGLYTLRFQAKSQGFNLNKIGFSWLNGDDDINPNIKTSIRIYPNPADQLVTIEIINPDGKSGILEILDLNGRILFQKNTSPSKNFTLSLDTSWMNPGVYILRIINMADTMPHTLLSII